MSSAGADPSSAAPASSAAAAGAAAAAVVAAAAAGAGPSSAAPASSSSSAAAAAAAVAGAPAGSVFVKRSDDARARFAPVEIFVSDAVGHLAKRASLELNWRTTAAYVDLFLVSTDVAVAVEGGDESAGIAAKKLFSGASLAHAGVSNGAFLLARLSSPPEAAPGGCARARGSQHPFVLVEQGGRRGSRDVREIPVGSSRGAHPFPSSLPFHPSQAAAGAVAVAAMWLQHPATRLFLHLFKRPWRTSCAARRAATLSGASSRLFTTRLHPAAHAALGPSTAWA
jgi:hypothetical protein